MLKMLKSLFFSNPQINPQKLTEALTPHKSITLNSKSLVNSIQFYYVHSFKGCSIIFDCEKHNNIGRLTPLQYDDVSIIELLPIITRWKIIAFLHHSIVQSNIDRLIEFKCCVY